MRIEEVTIVKYSQPTITMAESAVQAIQTPHPFPKPLFQILDSLIIEFPNSHTVSAYAADE
jgi:hypothetical protein